MNIIKFARSHEHLASFLYRMTHPNKRRVKAGNKLVIGNCFANSCEFIVQGYGNEIIIHKGMTYLNKCKFHIYGNNNKVYISNGCKLKETIFHIEDDNNEIVINPNVRITGSTQLAAIEGTKIEIGQDCLLSQNIIIRTGDSHSILNGDSLNRINQSKSVIIGNHCWIGHSAILLKGTIVGEHSVVATGAILTGKKYPNNSILGGVPAKVLKQGINWCDKRI